MTIIRLFVTWFYSGLSPKAPGTMGTLAAMPVGYLIHMAGGMPALIAATLVAFFGGWWASALYMKANNKQEDPQEIVIDEVAGVWAVLCLAPLMYLNPAPETVNGMFVAAFIAFRLFDIWKPWPVSLADRRVKGALGVMLDDLLAAVYAVLTLGVAGHALRAAGIEVPMR